MWLLQELTYAADIDIINRNIWYELNVPENWKKKWRTDKNSTAVSSSLWSELSTYKTCFKASLKKLKSNQCTWAWKPIVVPLWCISHLRRGTNQTLLRQPSCQSSYILATYVVQCLGLDRNRYVLEKLILFFANSFEKYSTLLSSS